MILSPRRNLLPVISTLLALLLLALFRSPQLISDGMARSLLVESGDLKAFQFGDYTHFLQVPAAHYLLKFLRGLNLNVSAEFCLVLLGMLGNILGAFAFAKIVEFYSKNSRLSALSPFLFSFCLVPSVYWNGELATLGLGFAMLSSLFALRRKLLGSVLFLVLACLSRIDFIFISPGLALFYFWRPGFEYKEILGMIGYGILVLSGFFILLMVLAFSIGKISGPADFQRYFNEGWSVGGASIVPYSIANFFKAIKGSVSAFTFGAHIWGDLFQSRLDFNSFSQATINIIYLFFSALSILMLFASSILCAIKNTRLFFIFSSFIAVPLLYFNARYLMQSEEYHAPALVGWLLLVSVGISYWPKKLAEYFIGGFVLFSIFGLLIPLRIYGKSQNATISEVLKIFRTEPRIAIIACNTEWGNLVPKEAPIVKIYELAMNFWTLNLEDPIHIQRKLSEFTSTHLNQGDRVFISGVQCLANEYREYVPALPVSVIKAMTMRLDFLNKDFDLRPLLESSYYYPWSNQTDPLSWKKTNLLEIFPKH